MYLADFVLDPQDEDIRRNLASAVFSDTNVDDGKSLPTLHQSEPMTLTVSMF